MKKQILFLALFLSIGISQLSAQNFVNLLKSGEYEELATYFSNTVKIEFNRDKKVLPKAKALKLLKSRMEEFQPVSWEKMHKGSSGDKNSGYVIAKTFNADNEGLRIFIHLEDGNNKKTISGIRIRKLL